MEEIEEQIAHLQRAVEEMSDVIARQDREILRLGRQLAVLAERERAREQDGGGGLVFGDERPPHY